MSHQSRKDNLIFEAEELGLAPKDLKILSMDPYMVGSEGEYRDATWAAGKWDTMMGARNKPIHIRGFHYWCYNQVTKPDGTLYGADLLKDWRWLLKSSQVARYLGIGEWRNLIDVKHPSVYDYDEYNDDVGLYMSDVPVQEVMKEDLRNIVDTLMGRALEMSPTYQHDGYQTYHLEVWCEKNSMGGIIEPICKRLGAAYQPLVGQSSVEKVDMLAKRAAQAAEVDKAIRIWYIADWDRYGWNMVTAVARKLEFIMIDQGIDADVKLTRLALNDDQIKKFDLPKAPKLGEAVVELDALEALHPGELSKIIRKALNPYVDRENPATVLAENDRMQEKLSTILEKRLRPVLEKALAEISDAALDDLEVDLNDVVDSEFEMPERDLEIMEVDEDWVFDSKRDWFDQLEIFQRYKEARTEEAA